MASSSTAGTWEDMKNYMELLADVRRAAVIICDSIRVKEFETGQITQPEQTTASEEAPRCPICTFEFDDPTVVLSGCGHGMHSECADNLMGSARTAIGDNQVQMFACPMCRSPFRRRDVVLLRSVIPSKTSAVAWRTVQLTSLWEAGAPPDLPANGGQAKSFHELVEELYVYIRATFRNANDLSYAIGGAAERYEEATRKQIQSRNFIEEETRKLLAMETRIRKDHEARSNALDKREKKLLGAENQNNSFLTTCMRSLKREEWKQICTTGSTGRLQVKLQSTLLHLGRTQVELEKVRRELEVECGPVVRMIEGQGHGTPINTGGPSAPAEESPVLENSPVDVGVGLSRVANRASDVIDIEESSTSNDEAEGQSSVPQRTNRDGENERRGNRLSQRRGGKRLRRNYRIE